MNTNGAIVRSTTKKANDFITERYKAHVRDASPPNGLSKHSCTGFHLILVAYKKGTNGSKNIESRNRNMACLHTNKISENPHWRLPFIFSRIGPYR